MSALRRSSITLANAVLGVLWTELKAIAQREGPDSQFMLPELDISVDFLNGRQTFQVKVFYKQSQVWQRQVPLSEAQLMSFKDEEFVEQISQAMRGTLTLAGQMQQARLEKMFPNSIKGVEVVYDNQRAEKLFKFTFKNGHTAEAYESEVKTDLFTARCTMLYDLPTI